MKYTDLEKALEEGHKVQLCTINDKGQATQWNDVVKIDEAWDVSRYRIIKTTGEVIDGLSTDKESLSNIEIEKIKQIVSSNRSGNDKVKLLVEFFESLKSLGTGEHKKDWPLKVKLFAGRWRIMLGGAYSSYLTEPMISREEQQEIVKNFNKEYHRIKNESRKT